MTSTEVTPLMVSVAGVVTTKSEPGQPAPVKERGFSTFTRSSSADITAPLLGHTPRRKCATLTFTGSNAGDSCYLCDTKAGASPASGAPVGALITTDGQKTHPPIQVHGTAELWLAPGQGTVQVGVISEQESMP